MDYFELGKTPISEDQPAGVDVRYEPEFEALQTEIDKLGSPTASGQVDWDKIVAAAAQILDSKAKDLTVASYLAVGLVHTQGVNGLDQGLQVIRDMTETFWDKLYPPKKRMRGRLGALTWWLEKSEAELQKLSDLKPLPSETVQRMLDNLKSTDDLLVEKMPEPPMLRPIQRVVERFEVEKEEVAAPEPEPQPSEPATAEAVSQTTTPTPPKPAAAPQAAVEVPAHIEDPKEAAKAVDSALKIIRSAAGVLLAADIRKPLAYRLRRIAAWAKIDALPPNNDGVTQIPPPAPQVADAINQFRESGNIEALVANAEQKISQYVFWFDINRMVAEGLKDLGSDYQAAYRVVCQETAGFAQRLQGIETLSFSDGLPFADNETRSWLKTIGADVQSGATEGAGGGPSSDETLIKTKLQEAKTMARKKKLVDGVYLLQKQMRLAESRCAQMRWRLAMIQLLLSVKKNQLALPHAQQVLGDIETFRLETWDPDLALEGLNIAWQTLNAQNTNECKAQAAELMQRIAGIDSVAALRM